MLIGVIPACVALAAFGPVAGLAGGPGPREALAGELPTASGLVAPGRSSPTAVDFRGARALRFSRPEQDRVDLGHGENGSLRVQGALSLAAVVQLGGEPAEKTPFISKWDTRAGGRSYELGVTPARRLFFAVSSSGSYDAGARELYTSDLLRVGVPYCVVAVLDPGKRMAVFVNGVLSGELTDRIPASIHDNATPVWLGNRPGNAGACGLDGLIAGAWVYSRTLDPLTIRDWARGLGLTDPPEQEFPEGDVPPVRAITRGPAFHWFGYYDKLQFDPSCRYVLSMEADFEGRSPTAEDTIRVGMVDTKGGDRWGVLGETRAWCWQQGCMLQWRPSSDTEVLWNDRQDGRFVCHILDTGTRRKRTIPHPVYTVSPDGRTAVTPDFRRVNDMRPGYGYAGLPDPNAHVLAPEDSGIFRVDLVGGTAELVVSIAQVAAIPYPGGDLSKAKHYFNHLLFSPDGSRFIFLHRWRGEGQRGFGTRMLTARPDGSDIRVVDHSGRTSHFIWRDPGHILAWTWHESHGNGFYLFEDGTDRVEIVGKGIMTRNGHCTYLPGNEWVLNDTYPDQRRLQHVYLYHVSSRKRAFLGHFESPRGYGGEWRCDTHPRFSPDARSVVVDSAHGGEGRQLYLIDVSGVVASEP